MSLASRLSALKDTFENKNATLRILFEQRLDTLRNNLLTFIGNAINDETTQVLNESDATRGFVVDRILELVSDNLESEKEITIYKLINSSNELTKRNESLLAQNKQLKQDNAEHVQSQSNIDDHSQELESLRATLTKNEFKIKGQSDKIASLSDELKIKTHELDRYQTQSDQQHEEIEKLHLKLEGALRTLGQKQTIFDQHSMENVNLKKVADQNKSDSKKHEKQIENLRKSLMKSESERLILRREYMEIGSTLKRIQRDQVEEMNEFKQQEQSKNRTILSLKGKVKEMTMEQKALRSKLHQQNHALSRKVKEELGKSKMLSDDVQILRKQLKSERNISKMYVDELQKLKFELSHKEIQITNHEKINNDSLSSQKKKIHKHYKKLITRNMAQLHHEYELNLQQLQQQYDETLLDIKNEEQQKHVDAQKELMLKIEEYEADRQRIETQKVELNECREKMEELKVC